jgi:hypothetical protein
MTSRDLVLFIAPINPNASRSGLRRHYIDLWGATISAEGIYAIAVAALVKGGTTCA